MMFLYHWLTVVQPNQVGFSYDIPSNGSLDLLTAELYGITQANIDDMMSSDDPRVKRFLGVEPGNGKALGLDDKFAYNIVKQLGNYGEMFDRNLGAGSPLKIERGPNRLFSDGGLMFPMAFQ